MEIETKSSIQNFSDKLNFELEKKKNLGNNLDPSEIQIIDDEIIKIFNEYINEYINEFGLKEEQDNNNNTILHLYISNIIEIDIKILSILIYNNKLSKNSLNETPLHLYCKRNKFDVNIANLLLENEEHKRMLDLNSNSILDNYLMNKNINKSIENIIFLMPKSIVYTSCKDIKCLFNNKLSSKLLNKILNNFGIQNNNQDDILEIITTYNLPSFRMTRKNLEIINKSLAKFYEIIINDYTYYIYLCKNSHNIIDVKIYKKNLKVAEGTYNETYNCEDIIKEKNYLLRINNPKQSRLIDSYNENLKHIVLYMLICSKKNIKFIPEPICIGILNNTKNNKIIMIMEKGDKNLSEYIRENKDKYNDNDEEAIKNLKKIILSLYNDLYYINNDLNLNFKHNDFKTTNIIISYDKNNNPVPLLIDFGLSQFTLQCDKKYDFSSSFQITYDNWHRNITHDILYLFHTLNYRLDKNTILKILKFKNENDNYLLNYNYYLNNLYRIITYNDFLNWIIKIKMEIRIRKKVVFGPYHDDEFMSYNIIPKKLLDADINNKEIQSIMFTLNKKENKPVTIDVSRKNELDTFNISSFLDINTINSLYYYLINYIAICDISLLNLTPSQLATQYNLTESDIIIDSYLNKYLKYKNKYLKYKRT